MNGLIVESRSDTQPGVAPSQSGSFAKAGPNLGRENRKEVRYPTCDAAEISLLNLPGLQVRGIVRDVSKNGLCIELVLPVNIGERLKISLPKRAIVFAVARHCRQRRNKYQVGAEIESVYYPNQTAAAPIQPDSQESGLELHQLARSIVQHHTSAMRDLDCS